MRKIMNRNGQEIKQLSKLALQFRMAHHIKLFIDNYYLSH